MMMKYVSIVCHCLIYYNILLFYTSTPTHSLSFFFLKLNFYLFKAQDVYENSADPDQTAPQEQSDQGLQH